LLCVILRMFFCAQDSNCNQDRFSKVCMLLTVHRGCAAARATSIRKSTRKPRARSTLREDMSDKSTGCANCTNQGEILCACYLLLETQQVYYFSNNIQSTRWKLGFYIQGSSRCCQFFCWWVDIQSAPFRSLDFWVDAHFAGHKLLIAFP
jgi:hypothetical protein